MTEREKLERVVNGLDCCLPMTTRNGFGDCKNCPYDREITLEGGVCECCHDLMSDALAMLKAQEPRVMTLDEIDCVQEHNCEYYTESLIEPNMGYARISYDGIGDMCIIKGTIYDIWEDMYDYNKTWRCWTSRPTDEQREATPWN